MSAVPTILREMAKLRTCAVERTCDWEDELLDENEVNEVEVDKNKDALVVLVWEGDVEEVVAELSRTSKL